MKAPPPNPVGAWLRLVVVASACGSPAMAEAPPAPGATQGVATPGCPFDAANAVLGIPLRQPVSEAAVRAQVDPASGLPSWQPAAPVALGDVVLDPASVTLYYSPTWLYQVNVRPSDPVVTDRLRSTLQALCGTPARVVDGTMIWTTGRVVTQWRATPPDQAGVYVSVYDG